MPIHPGRLRPTHRNLEKRSVFRSVSGLFCALLSSPLAPAGDLIPLGPEFIVTSDVNHTQKQPWVACDDDGRFVVSYSRGDVFVRVLDRDGNPITDDLLVNPTLYSGDQDETYVAVDPVTGDFVVVWSDRHGNDGHNMGIGGRFYAADGTPYGPEMILNTHTYQSQFEPHAAFSATGRVMVVWTDAGTDGSAGVIGRLFDRFGNPISGELLMNEPNTFTQIDGSVGCDRNGNFFVTFVDASGGTGEPREVLLRRFDKFGQPKAPSILVNTISAGMQRDPFIAVNFEGDHVVVWQDESGNDGDGWGIFARLFSADGTALGPQFLVPDDPSGDQMDPHVAMDYIGNFIVSWEDRASGNSEVMAKRYDRFGNPLSAAFVVHAPNKPGDQDYQKFAISQSGQRFISVWFENTDDYARLFDLPMITPSDTPRITETIDLDLDLPGSGLDPYWLVGAFSTSPGVPAPGFRTLDLFPDDLFLHCIFHSQGPIFFGMNGTLDASGAAQAQFVVPNDPNAVGVTLYMAAWTWRVLPGQMVQITDPISMTIE